jgi:RecA/RadA recombinase
VEENNLNLDTELNLEGEINETNLGQIDDIKKEIDNLKIEDDGQLEEKIKKVRKKKKDKGEEVSVLDLYAEFENFLSEKTALIQDFDRIFIPTGIDLLDAILGGGLVLGTMVMFAGVPGAGKSMLAAQCLANAQQIYEDLLGIYLDSEEATTTQRLMSLGVRKPPIKPRNNVTIEDYFKSIEAVCLFKEKAKIIEKPSMIILDSLANTQTQKERETDDPNTVIGYKARLLSCVLPKYISKINRYNISLIVVNQLRDQMKMGQFAPRADLKFISQNKIIPGGNSINFNAFMTLEMFVKSAIDPNRPDCKFPFSGIIVSVKAIKNKAFPPNIPIDLVGDFTRGFNNFWTNYKFLTDNKRLHTGAWNYLATCPDKKFRTKDASKMYEDDLEFKEAFDKMVIDTIEVEIIHKFRDYEVSEIEINNEEENNEDGDNE